MKKEESKQKLLGSIQVAQNKLARFLNGNTLMDKISTSEILKQIGIPSVNQINAQTKLIQVWKSQQSSSFPTQWQRRNETIEDRRTRASHYNKLTELSGGQILTSTFISDAARIWNSAPESIKASTSLYMAKKRGLKNTVLHFQSKKLSHPPIFFLIYKSLYLRENIHYPPASEASRGVY